ncbi:glycosyltransferase family 4 protein [Riemerella anatipestifer]|uniref:glycosyltransferase family 4 protein n=1 Tax=Riemerella anatipestifer TaxID=34085 RepID=UPI0007ED6E3D|nr:glycosyltransferase family 4 protein [Riemerella anatipestifer]MBT0564416.1 glycosyltransferase family 4 protein [Riemerella anatipestifer]MCO7315785.1 glycosyltransferase family 4 protein [Riemerella anatipestifer]MCO7324046.1 glycosyltransferase family 4 protein [Riemerella anatipestifer]MCQ4062690.1 glycosyltransferase family 4 protein [Riemerella anatipestifer]MCQ4156843.1 glycosyltransferase family 4 protein [Riemerella anatipestifer]
MNVLFLTLIKIDTLEDRGIYHDLLREFIKNNHEVTIVCPTERREGKPTEIIKRNGYQILKVKTFNIQKTHILEKGIATLAIEYQFLNAIKKHLNAIKFDMVLYSTPPITFSRVIDYVKKRDNAFSYLLLKDIFPQNAVDMKMIKKGSLIHRFFLKKEKKLYELSDFIGCMSPANVEFLLKHNAYISREKVEVNPNCITPIEVKYNEQEKKYVREKYKLPKNKKIFIYGGNLGKPQGLDFLLETIVACKDEEAFFVVVGSGTEYDRIKKWFANNTPKNAILLKGLPKNEYDLLVSCCDVGLIFLHPDFTIPNFPSRLLSYLECGIPILVAADKHTDIGTEVEKNKCGIFVLSGDIDKMVKTVKYFIRLDSKAYISYKECCKAYMDREFLSEDSYIKIIEKLSK